MRFKQNPLELIRVLQKISDGTSSVFRLDTRRVRHVRVGTPAQANVEVETFCDANIPFDDVLIRHLVVMPPWTIDKRRKLFEIS